MIDYDAMSDFEINKLTSKHVDFGDLIVTINDNEEAVYLCEKDGIFSIVPIGNFNPCNSPSDIMPIVLENEISIEFITGGYVDVKIDEEFGTFPLDDLYPKEKLYRACAICFLKMMEPKL